MRADETEKLMRVGYLLGEAADWDPDCETKGCTPEDPKCRDHQIRAANREVLQMLEPPHEGVHPRRLQNGDAERIFADEWKRYNERSPGLNHGFTALEHIMHPQDGQRGIFDQPLPERVSFRDAQVAASVVQWLGTNCGLGFLETCEAKIKQARAIRGQWPYPGQTLQPAEKDTFKAQAEVLAGHVYGTPKHQHAVVALEAALRAAYLAGKADNAK